MASTATATATATAGNSHSLPSSPATSPTAFLDDHPSFLRSPSSSSTFLLDLPGGVPAAAIAGAQEQYHPPITLHQAADQRKPPRKRPRAASRRPPTTVLTTDASNFRAMVQEFTGFPAPPPFSGALPSSHLLSGEGVLFPSGSTTAPAFQAMRASSPATNTTSLVLDALTMLAKTRAIATAAAAAAPPSSGSDLYGGYGRHMLTGAVPFDNGFEAADGESAGAAAGHGLFSSASQFAGESRY